MEINSILIFAGAFFCGTLSGLLYFWILWKSLVQFSLGKNTPYFVLAFLLRLSLLLSLIYFISGENLLRYALFMSGFFLAKLLSLRKQKKMRAA